MAYDKTVNKIVKWIDSRSIFSQKDGAPRVLVSEKKAIDLFCEGHNPRSALFGMVNDL